MRHDIVIGLDPPSDPVSHVSDILASYLARRPEDAARLGEIARRLREDPDGLFDRSCMKGHVTTSALLLSPDMRRILLVDHMALGRLLQPGGHYETVGTLIEEAVKEAVEETGVQRPTILADGMPIDVDTHEIPANPKKGEGAHLHHDFLHILRMTSMDGLVAEKGAIAGFAWHDLDAMAERGDRLGRATRRARELVDRIG